MSIIKIPLTYFLVFVLVPAFSQEKSSLYYTGKIPQNGNLKITLDSIILNITFFENQHQSKLTQILPLNSNTAFQRLDSIFVETQVETERIVTADSFLIQPLYKLDTSVVIKGVDDDVFIGGAKYSNRFVELLINSTPEGSLVYLVPLYKFNKKPDKYWLTIPDEIKGRQQGNTTPITIKMQRMVYAIIFDNHGKRGYIIYPSLPAVPEMTNNKINYHFP